VFNNFALKAFYFKLKLLLACGVCHGRHWVKYFKKKNMKKILLPAVAFSALLLSSCTMSRDASVTSNHDSQRLITQQEIMHTETVNKTVAPTANQALQTNPQTAVSSQQIVATYNSPTPETIKKGTARRNFIRNTGQVINRSLSLSRIEEKGANLVKLHTATASTNGMGNITDKSYAHYMILFAIATIIFAIIGFVVVHLSLLALIAGILLLISFVGFLIFMSMWLWRMHHPATMDEKNKMK
jgi:hypothetical protein